MKTLDKDRVSYFWDKIKKLVDKKTKKMVISSDSSVKDWVTVTQEEFDTMKTNSNLVEGTVYNVLDGSVAASTSTPIGASIIWYGPENTIPSEWMREDGRSLNKNEYPSLFKVLGYTYGGSGDNFNLPDSRGKVIVHVNESETEFNTLNKIYGEKKHLLTTDELPSHTHGSKELKGAITGRCLADNNTDIVQASWLNDRGIFKTGNGIWEGRHGLINTEVIAAENPKVSHIELDATHEHTSVGGNQPHNNIQPSLTAYRIIKVKENIYTEDLRNVESEIFNLDNRLNDTGCISIYPTTTYDFTVNCSTQYELTLIKLDGVTNSNPNLFEFSDGQIKIKKTGLYKVSCELETWSDIKTNTVFQARIRNNTGDLAVSSHIDDTGSFVHMSCSPLLMNLNAGDIIGLYTDSSNTDKPSRRVFQYRTYLTVEKC